jgi:hypothetical protein
VAAAAQLSMISPCFQIDETRELTLRIEEEGRSASKTSHAGIIRIGFEGISQPHIVEHPCFNISIETLRARFGKWGRDRAEAANNSAIRANRAVDKIERKRCGSTLQLRCRRALHFLVKMPPIAQPQAIHLYCIQLLKEQNLGPPGNFTRKAS